MKIYIFKFLFISLWLSLFYFIIFYDEFKYILFSAVDNYKDASLILLFIIQTLLALFILPCSFLAILFGMIYGFKLGIIFSIISGIFASTSTFIVGKIIKNRQIRFLKIPEFIDCNLKKISKYTWKGPFLAYINPFLPGSSLGYVFAYVDCKFIHFFYGMLLGTIPLNIVSVYFGNWINQVL